MSEEQELNSTSNVTNRDKFLKRKIHPEQSLAKVGDKYDLWKMLREKGVRIKE